MVRLLLLLFLSLTPLALAADCSGSFCSDLRYQELDESSQFSADITNYETKDNIVFVPLSNANGDELVLQVSILDKGKVRVKVLEKDHNRYELVDVLVEEFTAVGIMDTITEEGVLRLAPEYNSDFIVNIYGSAPFSVEVLYSDRIELALTGDRLVMRNNDESKAFTFDVKFQGAEKLYGLHHHAYPLTLGETADGSADPFHLRNSDNANYALNSTKALYGATPVVYGHSFSTTSTSGIFLHNAAEQWIDISYSGDNPSAYFMVDSGTFDLFIMVGPTIKEVVRQFTDLTGRAHLPQLWALGYHQCRYSYESQEDVKEVVANMDNNDFPMDAIWLDIDYTDEKKYFTWNPDTFSDPEEMQANLSATNRKLVTIIDPHYKVDEDYPVYVGGKDFFVKLPDGSIYEDNCWPGKSSWFDYLNPEARDYYASWFAYDKFVGSTEVLAGIWNDMNEPAVFNGGYENTMPFEALHIGDVPHRDVHNIYGFLHTKATHQGLIQRDDGKKRPFILTRSHFAGSQRYAAMWTGDSGANWGYLQVSYPACVNSNLMGLGFCGADIGGFIGNPSDDLLQRWYQAGVWYPFFREHADKSANRREPYLFSDEVQSVIRNAIKLRYKLIPYWYTLFYEHSRYGDPIIRPFFYEFPEVPEQDDHVLVGSDILARPVLQQDQWSVTVVFPGSDTNWYRVDDDSWSVYKGSTSEEVEVDMKTSPYYYRAGSIIPVKEAVGKSTTDMQDTPLTLYVNLDENNNAEGRYYQDDYESFKYSEEGIYLYITFTYDASSNGVQITVIDGDSQDVSPVIKEIIVHKLNEDTELKYTTNSEGIPLDTIDIAGKLRKPRTNKTIILL